ncbi:MAG: hypothetical protein KAH20_03840 [Methylococcales bacterium]|nr:hypothetical protein [Methylococcales bacterium]
MKKRKTATQVSVCSSRNLVAKFAAKFNKTQIFKDKTKYQRNAKHKNKEPFPILLFSNIGKGSLLIETSVIKKSINYTKNTCFVAILLKNDIFLDKSI